MMSWSQTRIGMAALMTAAGSISFAVAQTPAPDRSPGIKIEPNNPSTKPPKKSAPEKPGRVAPEKRSPENSVTNGTRAPNVIQLRRNRQERAKALSKLYAQLTTANTKGDAAKIAAKIEGIWTISGSDTVTLLLHRATKAFSDKKPGLALRFLDVIVELAPDFSEGWNRRAIAHYMRDDFARALGDLRRTLALDPNHYKALEGLAQILNEVGQKKGALQAYRQLQRVHPFWPQAKDNIRQLERDVEGQGI